MATSSVKLLSTWATQSIIKIQQYLKLAITPDQLSILLSVVNKDIATIRLALKNKMKFKADNSLGSSFKIEADLALLKCYREKTKEKKRLAIKALKDDIKGNKKTGRNLKTTKQVEKRCLIWQPVETSFQGRIQTGVIMNLNIKEPQIFLTKAYRIFSNKVKKLLEREGVLKINVILSANFIKPSDKELLIDLKTFATPNVLIDQGMRLKESYEQHIVHKLLRKLEEFQERDSGWSLLEIISLKVNINKCGLLNGGGLWLPLPTFIEKQKAVVNIKNDDVYCFLWAVTAALHPAETHNDRVTSYPHFSQILNYDGIEFPIRLKDIAKFENLNNLKINVYTVEKSRILPVRLTKNYNNDADDDDESGIHLLLLTSDNENKQHYCLIKNLSRLLSKQIGEHGHGILICNRCLNYFYREDKYRSHKINCKNQNHCNIMLPIEKNILKFSQHEFQEEAPFIIYADLESILEKVFDDDSDADDYSETNSNTVQYQKHTPFSVAYYLHCSYDNNYSKFKLYRGKDCIQLFMQDLMEIASTCDCLFKTVLEMNELSEVEMRDYQMNNTCHICNQRIEPYQIKVRDHCHLTGNYRGVAHQACNLNYQNNHIIPVIFHNFSGYDSHFILKQLMTGIPGHISLLPCNKEKFISFTKSVDGTSIKYRFIDSFRFMPTSIDKLAGYLSNDRKPIVRSACASDAEFDLLTRKGIFPYDYIDCWDKLEETSLPPVNCFYNKLRESGVTPVDYEHAKQVWSTFNIQTLGEYSDLYLKTDVLLLADVFENYRKTTKNTYNLDPAHYFTAPGLSFSAMLKFTNVKLELLTDIDMVMFMERGIRGGISQCCNRYGKANNKYMGPVYDPSEPVTYLMYFDVVNLYGAAMRQHLPYGGFEWIEPSEWNIDIMTVADDADVGYIFECDLHYPQELHQLHSDLPLAPEHMVPPTAKSNSQKKLLTTLYDKNNYVVHYRNLKLYLQLGLRIGKVHKILKFRQAPWLRIYIDHNTELRKQSRNDYDKNYYKLMNNATFGKCMENVRKRKDVRLVYKWKGQWGAKRYISKPNFNSCTILDENIAILELNKLEVLMNKPIYAGFAILEISKTIVYDFHYNYILKECPPNTAKLLYTDTDSLIYKFHNVNIYEMMRHDHQRFDTSDYNPNNQFNIQLLNRKVIGLMKDENNGEIMTEFVGLRSKMYSYRCLQNEERQRDNNGKTVCKSKGSTSASMRAITLEDYKNCLCDNTEIKGFQRTIRSKRQQVYTIKQKRILLSPHDDKRIISSITTDTKAWGYAV